MFLVLDPVSKTGEISKLNVFRGWVRFLVFDDVSKLVKSQIPIFYWFFIGGGGFLIIDPVSIAGEISKSYIFGEGVSLFLMRCPMLVKSQGIFIFDSVTKTGEI